MTDRGGGDLRGSTAAAAGSVERLRVFVSAAPELGAEREAAAAAIRALRLSPSTLDVARADVFVGVYWQSDGLGPDGSGPDLADEYRLAARLPRLVYVKEPAPDRDAGLERLLERVRRDRACRVFDSATALAEMVVEDLAALVTERFQAVDGSAALPSGTLTFLVVDLEGSTELVQRLGDGYPPILRRYHSIVEQATVDHDGHIVSREGDGLFTVFRRPVDAMLAAGGICEELARGDWPAGVQPRCRIGIHTGTANRVGQGYVGLDVNRVSQVGAAANGGQILVSHTTRILIEDEGQRRGWRITDLGDFALEGMAHTERLARLDPPGLPAVATPPRARPAVDSVLPGTTGPIVGRTVDLEGAAHMLRRDSVRLVTITGPGGTGKTRLALELAHRLGEEFSDGVAFVDLSAVRSPERFLAVVGRSVGVLESAERGIVEALGTVVGSARMLFVLDNMEQLLPAAPDIGRLIEALPNVKILVTSRAPLRLTWEHEYPLLPLPVPSPGATFDTVRASDAVDLFVQRARAVRSDFRLTDDNAPVLAEICRRLDGLPLAIELAAARLRLFTPETLLERLDHRLSVLDRGPQDAPERHHTLRAAIQWSHDLLEPDEQVIFRRLAVFSGGWPLAAALWVCRDDQLDESAVMDLLGELVAKSLVVFSFDEQGETRYRMLETLREFSLEQLEASGEADAVRRQHLDWCLSLAQRMDELLATPAFAETLATLDLERYNIREALTWSIATRREVESALLLCGLVPLFWDIRGYVTEGLGWMSQLLGITDVDEATPGRAFALGATGWLAMLAGDPERSERSLGDSDRMWRRLGDERRLAWSLAMHGMTSYNLGDLDRSAHQFEEAVEIGRRVGDHWLADGWCSYGLGHIALARGDFADAGRLIQGTLDYSRTLGLEWGIGHAQLSLGVLAFMSGDLGQAVARLLESLAVRRRLGDARGIGDCLGMMALLASVTGDHDLAAILLGAAETKREASGQHAVPWQQPLLEQAEVTARAALGEGYETRLADGRRLPVDEAIGMARERLSTVAPEPEPTISMASSPAPAAAGHPGR